MTRREAWLWALLIFLLALAVRTVGAMFIPFPIPEDSAYYFGVARNLSEGRGLVSDALWSYGTPARNPATGEFGLYFPRPAFEIWLPLPSLLAVFPLRLLGDSYNSTLVIPVIVGSLIPVFAWRIMADVAAQRGLPRGRARTLAVGSGVIAAIFSPLVLPGALLDSTTLFTAAALAACMLMVRLLENPGRGAARDLRLIGLALAIAVAAYARNEAIWIALSWAVLAWFTARVSPTAGARGRPSAAIRLRLIAIPAAVAFVFFAPWLVRNWQVFGNPLPGQALANALSLSGFDIFAWNEPPTLARYLAAGPATWIGQRIEGFGHNLVNVLLVPGIPVGVIGLLALPWSARGRAIRPLLLVSGLTFAVTTLVFPVATTWGTFLHASGPAQVLLLISCLIALDGLIVRVGRARGWTRPVAWLGPAFVGFMATLVLGLSLASYGSLARKTEARYQEIARRLAAAGEPLRADRPVIANHPIWMAEVNRLPVLALPDEAPRDVLDLARAFGARILLIDGESHGRWPGVLGDGSAASSCFEELDLAASGAGGMAGVRAYRVACA